MSVPYIHTFYTPKGYYFYDFNTNAIVRINKSVYDFLNDGKKTRIVLIRNPNVEI